MVESNYDAPYSVETFNAAPRFGHTNNLVRVITNQEGWSDYAQGCVFVGGFILAIFVIWFVVTCLFFCCGPSTVGILSGRRLRDANKTWKHCLYRSILLFSCVFSLMAGLIFLVKVTSSLGDTFDSVRDGIGGVADVARNVTSIADQIIQAGAETIPIRDTTVGLLNEGVCNAFEGGNGVTVNFDEQALSVVGKLEDLTDFSQDELIVLRDNFEDEFTSAEIEVNLVVDEAQNYARVSYYAISIIIVAFLLSVGGHMAWFGPRFRMFFFLQTWIILPLYFILLVFTVILVASIGAVLTVNSDACLPNPESFIKEILDTQNLDDYPQQIADFYIVNGCSGNFEGLEIIDDLINDLNDGNQAVVDLNSLLDESQKEFEEMCGGEEGSLDAFKSSLSAVSLAFSSLIITAEDVRNLLQCKPLNTMYKDFVHGGICRSLPNTLYWMFVTMMLVVAFGMVIFTLRGALVPSMSNDEREDYFYTASDRQNDVFSDDDPDDIEESALQPTSRGSKVSPNVSEEKGAEGFKDEV